MKKVSLCLILGNDYWGTVYSFERSGFKIVERETEFIDDPKEYMKVIGNVEVELLVAQRPNTDKRLIEYFEPLRDGMYYTEQSEQSDAYLYNKLFTHAKNEFICIFKPYVFLQTNWLAELMYYNENVSRSGVVSICSNYNSVSLEPLTSKELDNFVNVFIPIDNITKPNGISLFLREYLFFVGAFDESEAFIGGDEIAQFQLRCKAKGFTNFYVPTQSCLIIKQEVDPIEHQKSTENMIKTMDEMRKNKNYYIPLKTENHESIINT